MSTSKRKSPTCEVKVVSVKVVIVVAVMESGRLHDEVEDVRGALAYPSNFVTLMSV